MYSVSRWLAGFAVICAASFVLAAPAPLRVCADENNLPYSNTHEQGFENKLAQLVAQDLGRPLEYVWWPHSPLAASRMFRAGACDLIMGVPSSNYELAEPTRTYYKSSFVFVTRTDRHIALHSFDDPFLKVARIGLHVVGEEGIPPEQELARRGIIRNVVGYSLFGNFAHQNPPSELIEAVARGDVDVAIAWGPLAGYFAKNSPVALTVEPICRSSEAASLPLTFNISMGVERGNEALRQQLDSEIIRRDGDIRQLLQSYGVPLLDTAESSSCK